MRNIDSYLVEWSDRSTMDDFDIYGLWLLGQLRSIGRGTLVSWASNGSVLGTDGIG